MAAVLKENASAAFELKGVTLTLVAVLLKTTDLGTLSLALQARLGDAPEALDHDPVVIDLSAVRGTAEAIDFHALIALLQRFRMHPIAARAGSAAQMEEALAAGLVESQGNTPAARADLPAAVLAASPEAVLAASPTPPVAEAAAQVAPATPRPALVIDKPLRSGQRVYAKGGDLIVLAVVSYGAEVIADGNIHVYAPLRGRAAAGALGDTGARIFTTCMEAQLLSIAGIYRTTETELNPDVLGKPAQVRLDGEKLVVQALKS